MNDMKAGNLWELNAVVLVTEEDLSCAFGYNRTGMVQTINERLKGRCRHDAARDKELVEALEAKIAEWREKGRGPYISPTSQRCAEQLEVLLREKGRMPR